jgi:O-6-methylguanine DNA methyltransferase
MDQSPEDSVTPAAAVSDRQLIAVSTTNVFCRPGCPAPAPRPDHVERLASARQALFAGYRPCLRCRPLEGSDAQVTAAQLNRASVLRPILASARRTRRRRSGASAVVLRMLATPLGPMLAGTTDDGVCLLEFTDRPMLPTQLKVLEHRLGRPLVAGGHPLLDELDAQLGDYFAGRRRGFDLPLVAPGTPFQERVWGVLRSIPSGTTLTYEQLAAGAGRAGAQRAAGTANGANRLALVIPCHRVVRKSGETGNYGGGRWRKAWLLDHERAMADRVAPTKPDARDGDLSGNPAPKCPVGRGTADLSVHAERGWRPEASPLLAMDR